MPHSARIGRALLYRARSASTGGIPPRSHAFCLLPSWHVVTRRVALSFSRFVSLSHWEPVVFFGQVAGLGQTASVHRAHFSPFISLPVAGLDFRARGRTVSNCAHRATTVSSCGLCEHARQSASRPLPSHRPHSYFFRRCLFGKRNSFRTSSIEVPPSR